MAQDVNLQRTVLQKTLEEVAHDADHGTANPCVICLEQVAEVAIALPCKHATFDFICLVSWLEERPSCPLCQAEVTGVKYDLQSRQGPKIYSLSSRSESQRNAIPSSEAGLAQRSGLGVRGSRARRRRPPQSPPCQHQLSADDALTRRRRVYRNQLFSQRVGTNRLSQYREITPQALNRDENLVSRARKWIRRELQVFSFLNPDGNSVAEESHAVASPVRRRANNAEFLLEYIVAILRTVEIKGSGGQAEELLQEFLGRDNARLFLHELQTWLRSPYNALEDWDRAVQYDDREVRHPSTASRTGEGNTSLNETRPGHNRAPHQTHGIRKSRTRRGRSGLSQQRRVQNAREGYIPD